jgi:hypothetical protein
VTHGRGDGTDPPEVASPSAPVLPRARPVHEPRDATRALSIDPPPFWGRWGRIYLLVAGLLLLETVLLWVLTRWAR